MDKLLPKKNTDEYQIDGSVDGRWSQSMTEDSVRKGSSKSGSTWPKGLKDLYFIPDNRPYQAWHYFLVIMCVLSSMFTPFQFGFFRGLPRALWIIDLCAQVPFIIHIILRFFKAYKDPETKHWVRNQKLIAQRYLKKDFLIELFNVLPWDSIYKGTGHHEAVRCLVWLRVYRAKKLEPWFERLEKDIRFNYFAVRIVKLLFIEALVTHSAACFFYYLATTVKTRSEGYTWIGSLTLGSFKYENFRQIDLGKRYVTSLYWAVVTLTTVGYGDIHAVNIREMIFIMIFISFNLLLGSYLIGNISALIVKGSATEKFREKMASLDRYMSRHHLPAPIRKQMREHITLQFETGTLTEDEAVEDLPDGIKAKVANSIYRHTVERVPIFQGCSPDFLHEIVSNVTEEHFLPGEVVVLKGGASDNFYIVSYGGLEEIILADGTRQEEMDKGKGQGIEKINLRIRLISLPMNDEIVIREDGVIDLIKRHEEGSIFGEIGLLCNIPQPYTVRVTERCRVLRLDKHKYRDSVQLYFNDGQLVVNNLFEMKDKETRVNKIAGDVMLLVAKQAAELALMVTNASYQGDLAQLKLLVKQGAEIKEVDYDGRTALHLAASKGYEELVEYLISEGADVNAIDAFGQSPLMEAVKSSQDMCIKILKEHGAKLLLEDAGIHLCQAVSNDNNEMVRRLLVAGVDPSATDYDKRSPMHLAAADGHVGLTKLLIEYGANPNAKDRWGATPLDEAKTHQHGRLITVLSDAIANKKSS